MDCLFKSDCNKKNAALTMALMEMAFELGRAYEQIYLDLDLYNIINSDDLNYAVEKGAMFNLKEVNPENIAKARYKDLEDNRKYLRLQELKEEVGILCRKYMNI